MRIRQRKKKLKAVSTFKERHFYRNCYHFQKISFERFVMGMNCLPVTIETVKVEVGAGSEQTGHHVQQQVVERDEQARATF